MIHDAIFMLWDCPSNSHLLSEEYHREKLLHLNVCEREIFNRILQIGRCHGSIRKFIANKSYVSTRSMDGYDGKPIHSLSGIYIQALSEGLDEILEPYRSTLVELEHNALSNPYLPLSYVLGTVEKFKPLFNTITNILFSVKEKRFYGCQVLHVLQKHALSGNEETTISIRKLIAVVHRVFYDQLCSWLLYGDLRDNQREFFIHVVENIKHYTSSVNINQSKMSLAPSSDHSKNGSCSVQDFSNKMPKNIDFEINAIMLPYYIPLSMAQKILFIGRSVALFDSSPSGTSKTNIGFFTIDRDFKKGFTIWGEKEAHFHKGIQELKNLEVFNIRKLDSLLDEIKSCVTEHLWTITVEEAGVLQEIQLMKDFFLLGRGELFLELLRLSQHLLDMPPTHVSARDLNQAFNLAGRSLSSSNTQAIEKFYFTLPFMKVDSVNSDMEYGVPDGWTVLVLNYKVKWPLHLLFTPDVLYHYNEMFKFLLRVKKTQHDLHCLWFKHSKTKSHRTSTWQLQTKLMFLIDNLQHYMQFDVLESNYSKLRHEAERVKDFDLLKKAHYTFLMDILGQAFLLNPVSDETTDRDELDYGSNPVMFNIVQVLQLCDAFCNMARDTTDPDEEEYHTVGFTNRFDSSVGKLLQLLTALRSQPCGAYLARLLMRLDFNKWFSNTHFLKQSLYLS